MSTKKQGFRLVLQAAGGRMQDIAKLCRVTPGAVSQWKGVIPVDRCLLIERRLKGTVTRFQMRPDVFGPDPRVAPPAPPPAPAPSSPPPAE